MASSWIITRATKDGGKRFRVEWRAGGRESPTRYGGSFPTKTLALARKKWIDSELAMLRVPDLHALEREPVRTPTVAEAAERWQASRVDLAENTKTRHALELNRIRPLLGGRHVDELSAADVAEFVATLTREGYARSTTRKTLQTLQQLLDHAGVAENVARSKHVRLPRAEPEEISPPPAGHLEAVYRLLPSEHRLPMLWLDWSGARASSVDLTLVGDYDELRRRVRLRGDDEDPQGVVGGVTPGARGCARGAARPARGSRSGRAPGSPGRARTRCGHRSRRRVAPPPSRPGHHMI